MGIGLRGPRPHDAPGQRRAVSAAALVACLATLSAHAGGTNLRATVLDLQSGRPAQPLHVKLEFDAGVQEFQRVGEGEYALDLPAVGKRLALIADAPDQLVPRRVDLRVPIRAVKSPLMLKIYLADRQAVTYQNVSRRAATHCKGTEYDACLAYFEYAAGQVEGSPSIDQLFVSVEYNYGIALRNACEFLRYDTCRRAIEKFDGLTGTYQNHPKPFQAAQLTLATLTAAKKAAERIEVTSRYTGVLFLYNAQQYDAAAAVAEEMIEAAQAAEIDLRGTGITLDRLRQDAASARSLYGDQLQTENVSAAAEAYTRSKAHLLSVQTKTDRIARELAIITGKIAPLANP